MKREQDLVQRPHYAGPWFVSPHAVRRYCERIRPGIAYGQALGELIDQCQAAHFVKTRHDFVQEWRGPKPLRLRMRVHRGVLVTVLPSSDGWKEPVVQSGHGKTIQGQQRRQVGRRKEGR